MATPRRPQILLLSGLGLFVITLGYLVASSLSRRTAPAFERSPVGASLRSATTPGPDTVTIAAGAQDVWQFFDLDGGTILLPGDSAGWDLAISRFRLRTARTVDHLGPLSFPSSLPDSATVLTVRPESQSQDFGKWYSYSMLSHLLDPIGYVYRLRTDEGGTAIVQILSYYCPGLEAGCLTFRYLLRPPLQGLAP